MPLAAKTLLEEWCKCYAISCSALHWALALALTLKWTSGHLYVLQVEAQLVYGHTADNRRGILSPDGLSKAFGL